MLIDYGLAEGVVEKLLEAGIGTIEKLGSMTPEQLEEIPGVGSIENLQNAVNGYYSQFEAVVESQPAEVEEGGRFRSFGGFAGPRSRAGGPNPGEEIAETGDPAGYLVRIRNSRGAVRAGKRTS